MYLVFWKNYTLSVYSLSPETAAANYGLLEKYCVQKVFVGGIVGLSEYVRDRKFGWEEHSLCYIGFSRQQRSGGSHSG
jgi:hypothetical protein